MAIVGQLSVVMNARTARLLAGFNKVTKGVASVGKAATKAERVMRTATAKMTESLGKVGKKASKVAGTVSKEFGKLSSVGGVITAAFVAAGGASLKFASSLQETRALMGEVFGKKGSKDVQEFSQQLSKAVGRSANDIEKTATQFGAVLTPMVGNAKAAKGMSKAMTQLGIDMASTFEKSDAEAFTSLGAIITGEQEPLKKFGIVMSENALNAFAQAEGIKKSTKEMNDAEKTALRFNFVLSKTGIAQNDASRTSTSFANQVKRLMGNFKDIGTTIGKSLVEPASEILQVINRVAAGFQGLSKETQASVAKFIVFGGVVAAGGTALALMASKAPGVIEGLSKITKALRITQANFIPLIVVGAAFAIIAGVVRESWAQAFGDIDAGTQKSTGTFVDGTTTMGNAWKAFVEAAIDIFGFFIKLVLHILAIPVRGFLASISLMTEALSELIDLGAAGADFLGMEEKARSLKTFAKDVSSAASDLHTKGQASITADINSVEEFLNPAKLLRTAGNFWTAPEGKQLFRDGASFVASGLARAGKDVADLLGKAFDFDIDKFLSAQPKLEVPDSFKKLNLDDFEGSPADQEKLRKELAKAEKERSKMSTELFKKMKSSIEAMNESAQGTADTLNSVRESARSLENVVFPAIMGMLEPLFEALSLDDLDQGEIGKTLSSAFAGLIEGGELDTGAIGSAFGQMLLGTGGFGFDAENLTPFEKSMEKVAEAGQALASRFGAIEVTPELEQDLKKMADATVGAKDELTRFGERLKAVTLPGEKASTIATGRLTSRKTVATGGLSVRGEASGGMFSLDPADVKVFSDMAGGMSQLSGAIGSAGAGITSAAASAAPVVASAGASAAGIAGGGAVGGGLLGAIGGPAGAAIGAAVVGVVGMLASKIIPMVTGLFKKVVGLFQKGAQMAVKAILFIPNMISKVGQKIASMIPESRASSATKAAFNPMLLAIPTVAAALLGLGLVAGVVAGGLASAATVTAIAFLPVAPIAALLAATLVGLVAVVALVVSAFLAVGAITTTVTAVVAGVAGSLLLLSVAIGPLMPLLLGLATAIGTTGTTIAAVLLPALLALVAVVAPLAAVFGMVIGALTAGVAVIGGLFSLLKETDAFERFQNALGASTDRVVESLEPFAEGFMALAGLFDAFMDVIVVFGNSLSATDQIARVLFQVFKFLALRVTEVLMVFGFFLAAFLTVIEGLALGGALMAQTFELVTDAMQRTMGLFVQGFGAVLTELGKFINTFTLGAGDGLMSAGEKVAKVGDVIIAEAQKAAFGEQLSKTLESFADGARAMQPDLEALGSAFKNLTELSFEEALERGNNLAKIKEVNESLTNVPQGFKVARDRFESIIPGLGANQPPGGSQDSDSTGGTNITGNTFMIVADSARDLLQQLRDLDEQENLEQSGNTNGQQFNNGGA